MSPYNYCAGNPVKFVDPDERTVYACDNGDGGYSYVVTLKDSGPTYTNEFGTYYKIDDSFEIYDENGNFKQLPMVKKYDQKGGSGFYGGVGSQECREKAEFPDGEMIDSGLLEDKSIKFDQIRDIINYVVRLFDFSEQTSKSGESNKKNQENNGKKNGTYQRKIVNTYGGTTYNNKPVPSSEGFVRNDTMSVFIINDTYENGKIIESDTTKIYYTPLAKRK